MWLSGGRIFDCSLKARDILRAVKVRPNLYTGAVLKKKGCTASARIEGNLNRRTWHKRAEGQQKTSVATLERDSPRVNAVINASIRILVGSYLPNMLRGITLAASSYISILGRVLNNLTLDRCVVNLLKEG